MMSMSREQLHTFQRLEQGSRAREATIEQARLALAPTLESETAIPTPRGGNRLTGWLAPVAATLGIPLLLACSPDAKAVSPALTPEPAAVATTPTPEPPPPPPTPPKPEATATAMATVTPPKEPEPPATATATPEAKKGFDCGILSPEACATGKYIEWRVPKGPQTTETIPVRGMGFTLEVNEVIRISEDLQVAGEELPQGHFYNGYNITAPRKDGKRYLYWGAMKPAVDNNKEPVIGKFGKNLSAGTVVARITSKNSVFKGKPYNFVVVYPSEEELKNIFSEQTKNLPELITNQTMTSEAGEGVIFFGVKPPTSK